MKKFLKIIIVPLVAIASFFTGFFVRQPKINKLRKQIEIMQKQLDFIQNRMSEYQKNYDNLLIQYKGLKVLQLKKKAEYEGKLKDNLVLQYGMKDYLNLLFDVVKKDRKLTDEENIFYKSFDNVIEGKKVGKIAFENIKEYVMKKHKREINELKICDCTKEYKKLEIYNKST